MSRPTVSINPTVLRWAREESGYDISEVADKLKITEQRYLSWEESGQDIPYGKFVEVATTYKRQLAVFLLPNAPELKPRPKDFRNLRYTQRRLSKRALQVIRDVNYFQELAREIDGVEYWKSQVAWLNDIETKELNSQNNFEVLRKLLDTTIDTQMGWSSMALAYKNWRNLIESKLGILVFQFPMPMDELQGLSFSNELPLAIVTNSNHTYSGRIFTLFHELGHILRRHSGMCLFQESAINQNEELACNQFAAQFLVPAEKIQKATTLDEIKKLSSRLKVSREVYLRRLYETRMVDRPVFENLLSEIRESYKNIKPKGSAVIMPEVKSRASRGQRFYNLILEAVGKNQISFSRASSALNLGVPRIIREL